MNKSAQGGRMNEILGAFYRAFFTRKEIKRAAVFRYTRNKYRGVTVIRAHLYSNTIGQLVSPVYYRKTRGNKGKPPLPLSLSLSLSLSLCAQEWARAEDINPCRFVPFSRCFFAPSQQTDPKNKRYVTTGVVALDLTRDIKLSQVKIVVW